MESHHANAGAVVYSDLIILQGNDNTQDAYVVNKRLVRLIITESLQGNYKMFIIKREDEFDLITLFKHARLLLI